LLEVVEDGVGRQRLRVVGQQVRAQHDVAPTRKARIRAKHRVMAEAAQRVVQSLGDLGDGR